MSIQLSDHFNCRRLLRFTFPSIVMMLVVSIYSVVDGLFVSNLVGENALSAVNIMIPLSMIVGAFGFMLGTGGSAVVARTLGEGDTQRANEYFSMIIAAVVILGVVLSVLCVVFMEPLARAMGASEALLEDCVVYGRILLAGSVPFMLQTTFQSFFVVAERPHLGLAFSVAAGLVNMVLDYVFIALCGMGVAGAGLATVLGFSAGGLVPLALFLRPGRQGLRLVRPRFFGRVLLESCVNGSSEMMSTISASLVGILYNLQLMHMVGPSGVAAYSVMLYADFVFAAIFLGFSLGAAPVVSFHYGADNRSELRSLFRISFTVVGVMSAGITVLSEVLSRPLAAIFVGYNPALLEMTVHGFRLFALCYLCNGFNIFASAFFTALCDGRRSALISFLRTLVLRGGMVLLLPALWGLDGIWVAVTWAEVLAAVVSASLLAACRNIYHYG